MSDEDKIISGGNFHGQEEISWKCDKSIIGTKLPICKESEVGSKPMYAVLHLWFKNSWIPGVESWIKPRHFNSSIKSLI